MVGRSCSASRRRYRFEYQEADHLELLALLQTLPCSVILSGYPSALYDEHLTGWRSLEVQVMIQGRVRTEKLWFNFTPDRVHWPRYAGKNFTDWIFGNLVTLPVQEEIPHSSDRCRCCGTPFPVNAPTKGYNGRYELDVVTPTSGSPGLEVRHTKHVYLQRQCSCGHWTYAEPGRCAENTDWQVELTEWHLAGPMLVALICALSLRQRVSRRGVQEFLADWLGVSLSIAAIHQCLHEAGRAVAPVVERDIVPLIREAELLHVDETGWKEGKQLLWLWVFTCTTACGRSTRKTAASSTSSVTCA